MISYKESKKILITRYTIPDDIDAYSALGYLLHNDHKDLIQWAKTHLEYDPIDIEEAKDICSCQLILNIFFKFKNQEDAVQFLLSNNIEA